MLKNKVCSWNSSINKTIGVMIPEFLSDLNMLEEEQMVLYSWMMHETWSGLCVISLSLV